MYTLGEATVAGWRRYVPTGLINRSQSHTSLSWACIVGCWPVTKKLYLLMSNALMTRGICLDYRKRVHWWYADCWHSWALGRVGRSR
jgi:hypothetical protein